MHVPSGQILKEIRAKRENSQSLKNAVVAFSRDGERIAVGWTNGFRIAIYRTVDGELENEWPAENTASLEFNEDDSLLVQGIHFPSHGHALALHDPVAGKVKWNVEKMNARPGNVGFIPGTEFVFSANEHTTRVRSIEDGTVVETLPYLPYVISRFGLCH